MSAKKMVFVVIAGVLLGLGYYFFRYARPTSLRGQVVWSYLNDPASHADKFLQAGARCGTAPFIFPTNGIVGFIWDDSFRPGHRHQGLDIFSGTDVNITPVIAAYPGYLTRLPEWKSSVIIRVPDDPLMPGRQIWVYYTHMADSQGNSFVDAAFPPGTSEVYVEAGTLLGYQGNYSGDPNNPVGVHLHVSVVRDDGSGHFKNELDINNTYDPSPYFGMPMNANQNRDEIPVCPK